MLPLSWHIRTALPSDAEAISRLMLDLVPYVLTDPGAAESQPYLAGLRPAACLARIASGRFEHFVAEGESGICGLIAVRDLTHVFHLFVHADAHGRGVARSLWEHVRGRSVATTFTVNASTFAVPVYERLGFVATSGPQAASGFVFVPMVHVWAGSGDRVAVSGKG